METIEVRYSENPLGWNHMYLVYTDSSGNQFGARGGPSLDGPYSTYVDGAIAQTGYSILGDITTVHGDFDGDFLDYPEPGEIDATETIVSGADLSSEWNNIVNAMDQINAEHHEYRPLDQNSNTAVVEALRRAGLPEPQQDDVSEHISPGADGDLPSGGPIPVTPETIRDNLLFAAFLEMHLLFGDWLGLDDLIPTDLSNQLDELINSLNGLMGAAEDTVSPLILDLDGDGVETVHVSSGVNFDHDANGFAEQSGWAGRDDGLLVWDRNGNGEIDNGTELFGNNSVLPNGQKAPNGFAALAGLDSNQDGHFSSADSLFSTIKVWRDSDGDGHADSGELLSLASAGVQSIATSYTQGISVDANGNEHRQLGTYTTTGGAQRSVSDVWFVQDRARTINVNTVPVTAEIASLPEIVGFGNVASLRQVMTVDTSGQLKDLVEAFAAETDSTARDAILDELIFRWTGVHAIESDSRGQYVADARTLSALEAFMGRTFVQGSGTNAGTSSPGPNASATLLEAYENLSAYINAQLMSQTHYRALYEGVTLEWSAGGSLLGWDVGQAVALLEDVYDSNPTTGAALLAGFVDNLSHNGTTGRSIVASLRAEGDIEATGFRFELATIGALVVDGTSANDHLTGTSADELIYGFSGNDNLYGRGGNDIIDGGGGSDYLVGEAGSDTYRFGLGSGQDTISNYDSSTGRVDILELKAGISETDVLVSRSGDHLILQIIGTTDEVTVQNFFRNDAAGGYALDGIRFSNGTGWDRAAIADMVMQGTAGADTLAAFSFGSLLHGLAGDDTVVGHAGHDQLFGDDGDDVLSGAGGEDVLDGGGGDDTLSGDAGADLLSGGDGNDVLSGGSGNDVLEGGAGNDSLSGDAGNDSLVGNDGDDTLISGDGDDELRGGVGVDSLQGGAGDDTYYYNLTDSQETIQDTSGTDGLVLGAGITPDDITLYRVGNSLHVVIQDSPNQIVLTDHFVSGQSIEAIRFNNGTQWSMEDIASQVIAGTQNTQIGSWFWDEYYFVDHPDDVVVDEATGSFTVAPYSDDIVESWVPYTLPWRLDDLLLTGPLNIAGTGNTLDNFLRGNSGNNVLDGGVGRDTLVGGGGADTYIFRAGDGLDVIDCTSSDGMTDTIKLHGITPGALTFARAGDDLVISLNSNDKISLRGYYAGAADGLAQIDFVTSGTTWTGAYLASLVSSLQSEATNGNDAIQGSVLDDVLDGGAGADVMSGGDGHDTYYVDNAGDTIVEDQGQYARLDTSQEVYFQDSVHSSVSYTLAANLEHLTLLGSANLSGTGNELVNRLVGNSGANTFTALDGDDFLDGQGGADVMAGGAGDDVYIVDNGGDAIIEVTSEGWDSVESSVTFTLSDHVENLRLTGGDSIDATGNALNNYLYGNSGSNHLIGGAGNDNLDGGAGADILEGGIGDDFYYVRDASDVVVENAGEGTADRVDTYVDYTLEIGSGIERLTATGANITIRGNASDNELFAQASNTTVDGGAGNDHMDGYNGVATFIFGRGYGQDLMTRAVGTVRFNADTLASDVTVRRINSDLVIGIDGTDDVLTVSSNFGGGHQSMISRVEFADGTVWDYAQLEAMGNAYVNQAPSIGSRISDQLIAVNTTMALNVPLSMLQDPDEIEQEPSFYATQLDGSALPSWSYFDYMTRTFGGSLTSSNLGSWNIAVTGKDAGGAPATDVFSVIVYDPALAVTGTASNNSLTGTSGANLIDGLGGADTMTGGGGNDIYVVDSTGDSVVEGSNAGTDEIRSSVSITSLAANVERLTLLGSADLNATGNGLANTLIGNLGNNVLQGQDGNDTLYGGGAGADTLSGGLGDDIYIVDSADFSIIENVGEGIDEIRSYVSVTLTANVENALLVSAPPYSIGSANYNATGNALANTLTGNGGNNILDGGAGADTLIGGDGDDIYIVDNAADTVTESYGTDEIRTSVSWTLGSAIENLTLTGTASINGTGNDGSNVLTGNSGNNVLDGGNNSDTLNGGGGNDVLRGGDSDDVYIIDSTGASIVEYQGQGGDTVYASIDFALPDYVDAIELVGSASINATGNAQNNVLTGNAGNNILDGGAESDTMRGRAGNDTYYVDHASDWLIEEVADGTDEVRAAVTWTLDANFENLSLLGTSAINGTGNSLANTIVGNSADNVIDGSGGADTLRGGLGNDTYVLDDAGDVAIEYAGEGSDTVLTSFSMALGNHFENLTITGAGVVNVTGNAAANILIGNSAANVLDGGAGADSLRGGAGDDIYIIDDVGDGVIETSGLDEVRSSVNVALWSGIERLILTGSALNGTGNSSANYLEGTAAANTLDGGLGADTLVGGAGNDVYIIDDAADVVFESADQGIDEVRASISYALWGNIENLTLTGTGQINGTGNSLSNVMVGNSGVNLLDGSGGVDTLIGGAGGDTYVVDNVGDAIVEMSNEGTDLVQASVTYTLADNVERLTLTGTGNIDAFGNGLANVLTGNSSNNVLDGGAGIDNLNGGLGNDTYIVDGADIITESGNAGTDSVLSSVTFTLATNIEHLTLTGNANIDANGNTLDNTLTGNSGNNVLTGASGADTLIGAAGNDTLDGGSGVDQMLGGSGNDTYVVDSASDTVVEGAGEGLDLVQSTATFVLSAAVENLTLTSSGSVNGTGNELDNILIGNSGANTLYGLAGNDTLDGGTGTDRLEGGTGDDIYVVNVTADVIVEDVGAGNDTVHSSVTWTLATTALANVENLTLIGTTAINGTGNDLANVITGNEMANTLTGGLGADTLIGAGGNDIYVFDGTDVIVEEVGAGADTIQSAFTYTLGANIEHLTLTGTTAINGTGNELANTLTGNGVVNQLDGGAGNDTLNGGAGADQMTGGSGDDTFVVDVAGDTVIEAVDGGIDLVQSAVTYTLSANVENLTLTGTNPINATGNELANVLTGNSGINILNGGAGADQLIGGGGNDTYVVDDAGDVVVEGAGAGTDLVQSSVTYTLAGNVENITLTGSANIGATGNELANVLTGNTGANILTGGAGDDTYIVDNAADSIIESSGEGVDLVQSSITYTLAANTENLTLTGSNAINATGNALSNTLTGNTGANTLTGGDGDDVLNGAAGGDQMTGGSGNDTYVVDSTSDVVIEAAGEGVDLVQSVITYTLGSDVENLTLTSTGAINATGNAMANVLTGNSGANVLDGGTGADTMSGAGGNDTYVVDNAGDTVSEAASAGTDAVQAWLTYALTANVENLTLMGTGNIDATGNDLANVLTGNSGTNVLSGGLGDDTYVIDNAVDTVLELEAQGTDLVQAAVNYTLTANTENLTLTGTSGLSGTGNELNNVLTGNTGANTLTGGAGNDTLNGGTGADSMTGGTGDDIYVIDNAGDQVFEASGEGIDLVQSTLTYTLGNYVENLTLTGSAVGGTGNALDNILTGNSSANTLNGGAGNDTLNGGTGADGMTGGTGDDLYYVDNASDTTVELAGEGVDSVSSSIARTLASYVEILFISGSSNLNGTGNTLANLLRGNTGINTLTGAGGTDILEGGSGNDILVNSAGNTLLNGGIGTDTLTGATGNDLFIGGVGNDALTTDSGADIIVFNKGDGQDTVAVSTTTDNTVSIGKAVYADLLFQKSGNDLILSVGATDRITFTGYYASAANRSVNALQVVLEGTTEYDSGSGNVLRDNKIETFNFEGLVAAFDAARVVDPTLTSWALTNALLTQHLSGSDTDAIGGDLAYRYNRYGTLSDISFTPALGILSSGSFGVGAQALQTVGTLQDTSVRLS